MPTGVYIRIKPVWNKGTKGICKPNSGSFKKGLIPWCAGTKGIMKAWNKGQKIDRIKFPTMGHFVKHSEETKRKIQSVIG